MSIITTVRHFTGRFQHRFILVFSDRTRETMGDYWQNREPGGWAEDLHSPDLLGIVGCPTSPDHPRFGTTVRRPDGRGCVYGSEETLEEAVLEIRAIHAELVSDMARCVIDPAYALEEELRCHDWWYHMSDDGSVYQGGEAHHRMICRLMGMIPVEAARTLWEKYAPADFTCVV